MQSGRARGQCFEARIERASRCASMPAMRAHLWARIDAHRFAVRKLRMAHPRASRRASMRVYQTLRIARPGECARTARSSDLKRG
jgi:hypothetical protein